MPRSLEEVKTYHKKYRENNKERAKEYAKQYRKSHRYDNIRYGKTYRNDLKSGIRKRKGVQWTLERSQFEGRKYSAKKNNIEFSIQFEDLIWPEKCPVLGIPLDRRDKDHTPSIDRLDVTKGYVKGNVFVISSKANSMKRDNTLETLDLLRRYMLTPPVIKNI